VKVTDFWELNSTGSGMTNEIDSPPTQSVLYPITYSDGFQISWSQNIDNDFQSYKLYESLSEDMSNWTLVYETNDRTNTSFDLTLEVLKYYMILVEDVWGLQSISNMEVGDYYFELWGEGYSVLNTTDFDISNNQLTGSIPPEIGNLTNLTFLDLGNNQLTGEIPSEMGNLTNLTFLDLGNNQLTGEIPSEIGNLTSLIQLDLHQNELTGSIPPEIGNLSNLEKLYLFTNQLTGVIPEILCDLNIDWSTNSYFYITNNQFCPPYPSCIEDYVGNQNTSGCD